MTEDGEKIHTLIALDRNYHTEGTLKMQSKKILTGLAAISLSVCASEAQIMIYNNGVNYSGFYLNPGNNQQVADEIFIAPGYTASTFRFEYYGNNFHTGNVTNEQFRLRFYANNGTEIGNSGVFKPLSVFYDSGWQDLASPVDPSGRNTYLLDLSSLSLFLPDHFSWGVEFQGIDAGEATGLSIYHPPTVGNSENDYWFNDSTFGWQLRGTNGVSLSFGAQITAVPEPSTFVLAIAGGLCGLTMMKRRKRS